MEYTLQLEQWLEADKYRMDALWAASKLGLEDWCLSAGFVRNLVWDRLHGHSTTTPLNDIDFIYFDSSNISRSREQDYEAELSCLMSAPWSVKNQARMHRRNHDAPYLSVEDAMTYWVEVETAVGVCLSPDGRFKLLAPLGLGSLFNLDLTINPKRPKPETFSHRVDAKQWLHHWPMLKVKPLS